MKSSNRWHVNQAMQNNIVNKQHTACQYIHKQLCVWMYYHTVCMYVW